MSEYGVNGPILKIKICKIRFLKLKLFDFQILKFWIDAQISFQKLKYSHQFNDSVNLNI